MSRHRKREEHSILVWTERILMIIGFLFLMLLIIFVISMIAWALSDVISATS
jgi:hypothetical protein